MGIIEGLLREPPKRFIRLLRESGDIVRGEVTEDNGVYRVEVPITTPRWYTLWFYKCEIIHLKKNDPRIVHIDPAPVFHNQ